MTIPPARVGMAAEEIDTPALVIELDALERNLDRMARSLKEYPHVRLRGHAKTHKSPVITRMEMARGSVGACCQKVGEAEALVQGGVPDVLVTNQVVGPGKLARLAALARQARVGVCVDDAENAREVAEAARAAGVQLSVLVEVDIGPRRCGVEPGDPTLALAQEVMAHGSLRFNGVQVYHGGVQHIYDFEERRAAVEAGVALARQAVECLHSSGIPCAVVTGGGTGSYRFEAESGLYTELQAGSYVFMDADYRRVEGFPQEFEHALFVLATVMSRGPGRACLDAGLKAYATDSGLPVVHDRPDLEFRFAADEHGALWANDPARGPRLGEKLWLIPGHCDPTVNLYDWYVAVRGGWVEAVWPVAARGAVT